MNTKEINLLVFDTEDNFNKSKQFIGEENVNFKRIICVQTRTEFEQQLSSFSDNDLIFLVVHVFFTDKISGIRRFKSSGIYKSHPKVGGVYISDGDRKQIQQDMVQFELPFQTIYKYHDIQENLENGKFPVFTKKEILQLSNPVTNNVEHQQYPHFDYAVLTALYQDEFEAVEKVFEFPKDEVITTECNRFQIGYLKADKSKKIIASFATAAGMIDSAIIATQMCEYFTPKYLLMSGVCGGASDYQFGDIIVAQQIFTFQKGKLSDILIKKEDGKFAKIDIYDINKNLIDYGHLYDSDGNQIAISIEKFSPDNDAAVELHPSIINSLRPKMETIKGLINDAIKTDHVFDKEKRITIELAPIACSTMVINKDGYFEDTIKTVNRKTAAVEMESFGVARACKFANNGKTKAIIFKSVMDHTFNKTDSVGGVNWKKFAAYTSAQFMKHLLTEDVI